MKPTLLVVDDDEVVLNVVAAIAARQGFAVTTVKTGEAFLERLAAADPSALILDIVLPGMDGVEILKVLRDRGCRKPLLLMSGYSDIYLRMAASLARGLDLPLVDTVEKPIDPHRLADAVSRLLHAALAAGNAAAGAGTSGRGKGDGRRDG